MAGLATALGSSVGRIVMAAGTYALGATLSVSRSVILEAAVTGSVVLDAQASSSSPRRVLYINPGSSGVVQLIGLNITGGYTTSVRALGSIGISHAKRPQPNHETTPSPRWDTLLTCPHDFVCALRE